jgi:hypothetical protein
MISYQWQPAEIPGYYLVVIKGPLNVGSILDWMEANMKHPAITYPNYGQFVDDPISLSVECEDPDEALLLKLTWA